MLRSSIQYILRISLSSIVVFGLIVVVNAQHSVEGESHEGEKHGGHHVIQLAIGHTTITEGINKEGEKTAMILPSWAFNYNYHINHKWFLGFHGDMIVESFEVLENDDVVAERSRPVALAVMGGYNVWKSVNVLLGGGVEFAKEDNLSFMRFEVEPAWELKNERWELSLMCAYDLKFEAYNSWTIAFGVGYVLGGHTGAE